jgi:hypothetical protein
MTGGNPDHAEAVHVGFQRNGQLDVVEMIKQSEDRHSHKIDACFVAMSTAVARWTEIRCMHSSISLLVAFASRHDRMDDCVCVRPSLGKDQEPSKASEAKFDRNQQFL